MQSLFGQHVVDGIMTFPESCGQKLLVFFPAATSFAFQILSAGVLFARVHLPDSPLRCTIELLGSILIICGFLLIGNRDWYLEHRKKPSKSSLLPPVRTLLSQIQAPPRPLELFFAVVVTPIACKNKIQNACFQSLSLEVLSIQDSWKAAPGNPYYQIKPQ